jgi:serine/threonine protein kinase
MTGSQVDPQSLEGREFYKGIFRVDKLVAEGGFSYVYRGSRLSTGAPVAVKAMKAQPGAATARLLQEARRQIEAREKTAAIVEVYEVLEAAHPDNDLGVDLFVMEWVDGQNLYTPVAADLPPVQRLAARLRIAIDLCRGVEALHGSQRWHGDITPGNVLAFERRVDGWGAKLIDLGLSRDAGYRGRTAGTALYLAPEQVGRERGDYGDLLADLYSLGAVLFHLFADRHHLPGLNARSFTTPLDEAAFRRIADALQKEPPLALRQVAPDAPEPLSDLVAVLLRRDPEERDITITEVRERLEKILSEQLAASFTTIKTDWPPGKPALPDRWDVRMLMYRIEQDHLTPVLYPLGFLDHSSAGGAPLSSPLLSMMAGQDEVHVVLVENTSRQPLATISFEVDRDPFRIYFGLNEQNDRYVSHDGQSVPMDLDLNDPLDRYTHVALRDEIALTDLAFLIDGTMAAGSLDLARSFALWVAQGLRDRMPLRLACVLYGEYRDYPHPPHRRRRIPYEIAQLDFCGYHEFEDYLTNRVPPSAGFMDQDLADALELGLHTAGKLSWWASLRYLIVVGNSPPHPTGAERERYRLLDFSTGQFRGLDWYEELLGLRESGLLNIQSYYIEPDITPDEEQIDYVEDVWTALDDDRPSIPALLSTDRLNEEVALLVNRIYNNQKLQLVPEAAAPLPTLADRHIR